MRPRDLYDVIQLYKNKSIKPNKDKIKQVLIKKCNYKKVTIPYMEILDTMPNKEDLRADWQDMLGHQIADLDSFEHYWQHLPTVFKWINN